MKKIFYIISFGILLAACGQSYEETKRINRQQRRAAAQKDSAALKIAVMPTLDCLPLFVARHYELYDTILGGVRLKCFNAQMDCDTAFERGRVEGVMTDLVRAARMEHKGLDLRFVATTNAYWQLISNRNARIRQLKQMDDKMVAMTRYSVTDMLADKAIDSAKLDKDHVFKVQINDVYVRLQMLQNNIMDVLCLTEPHATVARVMKNHVLLDTRALGWKMGAMVFREKEMRRKERAKQLAQFIKAYDQACDSINKYGVKHYRSVIEKNYGLKKEMIDSLPGDLKFPHAQTPRKADMDIASAWWEKQKQGNNGNN